MKFKRPKWKNIKFWKKRTRQCSFCEQIVSRNGKPMLTHYPAAQTKAIICSDCILTIAVIVEHEQIRELSALPASWLPEPERVVLSRDDVSPKILHEYLDRHVIGQDQAKKVLSVAVYNHYKRISGHELAQNITKGNVLLLGPTGSGKTFLLETLSKYLKIPLGIADASNITETGYYGMNPDCVLWSLYEASNRDVSAMEQGICYIDEVDKLALYQHKNSTDISGGAQKGLLKIIEGSTVMMEDPNGRSVGTRIKVNTKNILFILGGSFTELDRNLKLQRKNSSVGFTALVGVQEKNHIVDTARRQITSADIIKFGFMPEFMGRIASIVALDSLTETDIYRIITSIDNSLVRQYQNLFALDDVDLEFTDECLLELAHLAVEKEIGARGLKFIFELLMLDAMYERRGLESKQVTITIEDALKIHDKIKKK